MIHTTAQLGADRRTEVLELIDSISRADGIAPLSEYKAMRLDSRLDARSASRLRCWEMALWWAMPKQRGTGARSLRGTVIGQSRWLWHHSTVTVLSPGT